MASIGSLLQGFSRTGGIGGSSVERALQGRKALDIRQQEADTREQLAGVREGQLTQKTQNDAFLGRLKESEQLTTIMTNKNMPDTARIKASNDYFRLAGIPFVATDIGDVDPIVDIATKMNGLAKQHEKGEIDTEAYVSNSAALANEVQARLGESGGAKGAMEEATRVGQREFDNDVAEIARILENTSAGGAASTGDASMLLRLQKKFPGDPERVKAMLRDATKMVEDRRSGRVGKVSPDKFTGESLEEFQKTGRFTELERRESDRAVSRLDLAFKSIGIPIPRSQAEVEDISKEDAQAVLEALQASGSIISFNPVTGSFGLGGSSASGGRQKSSVSGIVDILLDKIGFQRASPTGKTGRPILPRRDTEGLTGRDQETLDNLDLESVNNIIK